MTVGFAALSVVIGNIVDTYFVNLRAAGHYSDECRETMINSTLLVATPLICYFNPALAGISALLPRALALLIFQGRVKSAVSLTHPVRMVVGYYTRIFSYTVDSVVSNLNARLDSIAVWFFLGEIVYAQYQPTARLLYTGLGLASFVGGIAIPKSTTMPGAKGRWFLLRTFSGAGLAIGAGLWIGLVFFAQFLFGSAFQATMPAASLLAVGLALRYMAAGAGSYLTITGRQQRRAMLTTAITGLMVTGLFFLSTSLTAILALLIAGQLLVGILYFIEGFNEKAVH